MGANHARVLSNLGSANLVAVADVNDEHGRKIANEYNATFYQDYKEMLDKENIQAVCIAVPTKFHKETTLHAVAKGKHVLLEKPIANSEEEAKEIIKAANKNNVKLMIGHIERFNPVIVELKKRLDELGDIYKIDVQRIGPFPGRVQDVGVIIDLSVHDIDIIQYLTRSEIKRVYAETQQRLHPNCEDSVTALIKYQNGVFIILYYLYEAFYLAYEGFFFFYGNLFYFSF